MNYFKNIHYQNYVINPKSIIPLHSFDKFEQLDCNLVGTPLDDPFSKKSLQHCNKSINELRKIEDLNQYKD